MAVEIGEKRVGDVEFGVVKKPPIKKSRIETSTAGLDVACDNLTTIRMRPPRHTLLGIRRGTTL